MNWVTGQQNLFISYNMKLFSSHYSYHALLRCQYDTEKSIDPRLKFQGSLFVIPINTCVGWHDCSGPIYKPIKTKKEKNGVKTE